jgi:phage-related protein
MSELTYALSVGGEHKPVVWLSGEVKTPSFSKAARLAVGFLIRRLKQGETVGMPHVKAMPSVERRRHELRIVDEPQTRRILLRIDADAVVILHLFSKKTKTTPKKVIEVCRERLQPYDAAVRGDKR